MNNVIDDQHLDGRLARLQLQAKLPFQGAENRGARQLTTELRNSSAVQPQRA
jgi:hypothetical protein